MIKDKKIAIIGLGYVGLPLAVEFGKRYSTVGFDISISRINELNKGLDNTGELTKKEVGSSVKLNFTNNINDLKTSNIYIVSVPTPIDENNNPNLSVLFNASKLVGGVLKKGDIVIYESTVYPGCTEEDCVPLLEQKSGLKYNKDFFCGYSPERINPGDKKRTVTKIIKITSGSNEKTAHTVDELYKSIIQAGTYKASSIRIAEAAKIIENCQRDINIAFVNELSIIFNKMNLDTNEILSAAETKWNFLPFKPGLVGGHCIGVDPYYLTYKSKDIGYNSKIILSGRKLNDSMPNVICDNVFEYFSNKKIKNLKILILGVTFKENCSDTRNSKVVDIFNKLIDEKINIDVCDPVANKEQVLLDFGISLTNLYEIKVKFYDGVIVCVGHKQFLKIDVLKYLNSKDSLVYDLKNIYNNKKFMRL